MFQLLALLFIIKLYVRSNFFKLIKKKHGQDVITAVHNYEKVKTKWMKVDQDIKFIKPCKKEHLVPTFKFIILTFNVTFINKSHGDIKRRCII